MECSERRALATSGEDRRAHDLEVARRREVARGIERALVWLGLLSASGLVWAAALAGLRHLLAA